MPKTQAAHVPTYQFGAPDVEAAVLKFRVVQGGAQELRFETPDSDVDIEVTVQVSEDNSAWSDTTAAANGEAVANETIKPHTSKNFSVNLRAGLDNYMRVQAAGGNRCTLQIRGQAKLEILQI